MAKFMNSFCFYCIFLMILMNSITEATNEKREVYIVYMGSLPKGEYLPSSHHLSILQEVVEGSSANDVLVRSYKRSFNGFAANLTNQEQQKIARMEGVVSVFPSKTLKLQTTRSWNFIGFSESVKRNPTIESDIIIGIVDSGIWPESESFSDEGFGPPPKKWKARVCNFGKNFTCNNKIVGARNYIYNETARDNVNGHGTHAASIAAGNKVIGANFLGLAKGNARGGVPSSRIAVYKVCGDIFCYEDAFLAAFDDAIADGVDIISIQTTYSEAKDFTEDVVAIGAFHAMQKGIITSQAAGNLQSVIDIGPAPPASTASVAPWILSVAASTTDRRLINKVTLGDGTTFVSDSINAFKAVSGPLQYGGNTIRCPEENGKGCTLGCLDEKLVKGKIVVCDRAGGQMEAYRVGAIGSLSPDYNGFLIHPSPCPAFDLKNNALERIKAYMNSSKNPYANITKSLPSKAIDAPVVADFSARGPNLVIQDIIKPDITAPGVEILGAFPPVAWPSALPDDNRHVNYTLFSGTSASCPHATAAAAYVKTFHPDWSSSSVKSALMTTARPMNAARNPHAEFAYGSGQIDPVKAINPGLVYEILEDDYIKTLCSIGYDEEKLRKISGNNSSCTAKIKWTPKSLNYPSMAARVTEDKPFTITFPRTAKNVGFANSTYKAQVTVDSKIKVNVAPSVLSFKSLNEKKSFVVTVAGKGLPGNFTESASLVWFDGIHSVRSPITLYTNKGKRIQNNHD